MRKLVTVALLVLPAVAFAAEEEEPEPQIKITDWSMDRARKDRSGGTNLVRALMKIENIGEERIETLSAKLVFYEAMGGKLGATRPFRVREIKSGESAPLVVQAIFVPIFGSYELHVDYKYGKEKLSHRYLGSSPFSPPTLITKELLPKTAKVVVLGHEIQYDPRSRRAAIAVRLKNLGEMDGREANIHMKFYDKNSKLIGRELTRPVSRGRGDPKIGVVKGGEVVIMRLVLQGVPKYKGFDIRSSNAEAPATERLAGGEFKGIEEVEVAHLKFDQPVPARLKVGAKVRNGLKGPVEKTVVTFLFYTMKDVKVRDERRREFTERKQVVIKKVPVSIPGRLARGEVKDFSFEVTGVAHFTNIGYEAAYQEPDENTRKAMTASEVGEVVVQDVSCVKKGGAVEIKAKIVNRRKLAARDIKITFEFKRINVEGDEVTVKTVEHVIEGITKPGEERPLAITVADPPVFSTYFFNVSYSEGGPLK